MDRSRQGFDDLFRHEYASVVRAVAPIVSSVPDAESVTQEAFLKAFVRWGRLRRFDRPGAWVRRVAIRDAVRVAQRGRRPVVLPPDTSEPDAAIEPRLDLQQALGSLTPNQRASVVLHYLEGWRVQEVADALGCSDATVRVHLHRARRTLADHLTSDSEELTDGC